MLDVHQYPLSMVCVSLSLGRMTAEGILRQLQLQLMPVEDHTAQVGSFHCGLVHMPVCIQEAVKKPEAKAAVDK